MSYSTHPLGRIACTILWLVTPLSVAAVLFSNAALAVEASAPNVLFILDASGSMREKVDNQEKLTVAKQVMTNLVKELPDEANVGLELFGHRKRGSCDDIETVVPVSPLDKNRLVGKIQSIDAKGETPIAAALRTAGEQLKTKEEETTVVLVSDGKEECRGDPCGAIRDLKAQGLNVKVHVVGFDVGAEEKKQLSCIAEAGGGSYFSAKNAAQLKEALAQVRRAAIEQAPAVPAAPKMPVLPKGGINLESAVPLPLGDYVADREIKGNYEYFSVKVKAGQSLIVYARAPDTMYSAFIGTGAYIYNERKEALAGDYILRAGTSMKLGWLTNSNKADYTMYIGIGVPQSGVANAKNSTYSISVQDSFDANSGTDAGDNFEAAIKVTPGKYQGYLAASGGGGVLGDDKKDYYAIDLNNNEKITLKLIPPENGQYRVTLFDQDRVQTSSKEGANAGAITRVEWTAPSEQKSAYVLIENIGESIDQNKLASPYSLEISTSLEEKG